MGVVNCRPALAESYDGFQRLFSVVNGIFHNFWFLVAAFVQRGLQFRYLSHCLLQSLGIFTGLCMKFINFCVQDIHLLLVVSSHFCKVMFPVTASEMILQTNGYFPYGPSGMETYGFGTHSIHVIDQSRFQCQCPCLALSQVEIEVQAQFC